MRPNMILVYHCSHCPLFIYRHKNICITKKKLNSHNARKLDKYEGNSNKQAVNILYVRSNSLSTQGEHEIQVNKCLKWQKLSKFSLKYNNFSNSNYSGLLIYFSLKY